MILKNKNFEFIPSNFFPDLMGRDACVSIKYLRELFSLFFSNRGIENQMSKIKTLAMRILWSYFFNAQKGILYYKFVEWLTALCKKFKIEQPDAIDAIAIIEEHFSWAYASPSLKEPLKCPNIVLLIDELAKIVPSLSEMDIESKRREGSEFFSDVTKLLVGHSRLLMVVTAVDLLMMEKGSNISQRSITWIPTPRLSQKNILELFDPLFKSLSKPHQLIVKRCLVEANRHPRVLGIIFTHVKDLSERKAYELFTTKEILEFTKSQFAIHRVTAEALALGILGVSVDRKLRLTGIVADQMEPQVSDLVAASLYLHTASTEDSISVSLAGLIVRKAVGEEKLDLQHPKGFVEGSLANKSPAALRNLLMQLIEVETQFEKGKGKKRNTNKIRGEAFERFHCLFEMCKLHARAICQPLQSEENPFGYAIENGNYVSASLREHYQLSLDEVLHWQFSATGELLRNRHDFLDQPLLWPLVSKLEERPLAHFANLCRDISTASKQDYKTEKTPELPFYRFTKDFPAFDAAMVVREKQFPQKLWCILLECKHTVNNGTAF